MTRVFLDANVLFSAAWRTTGGGLARLWEREALLASATPLVAVTVPVRLLPVLLKVVVPVRIRPDPLMVPPVTLVVPVTVPPPLKVAPDATVSESDNLPLTARLPLEASVAVELLLTFALAPMVLLVLLTAREPTVNVEALLSVMLAEPASVVAPTVAVWPPKARRPLVM